MSRKFVSASSQRERFTGYAAPVLNPTYPLTLACWWKATTLAAGDHVIMCVDGTASLNGVSLIASVGSPSFNVQSRDHVGSSSVAQITSPSIVPGTWYHGCGVFPTATTRMAYLNGGNRSTVNNARIIDHALSQIYFGGANGAYYFDGVVAEAAVWNIDLTDEEVAALAKGVPAYLIKPSYLAAYFPMIHNYSIDIDILHNTPAGILVNAPTFSADTPPIIYSPGKNYRTQSASGW